MGRIKTDPRKRELFREMLSLYRIVKQQMFLSDSDYR